MDRENGSETWHRSRNSERNAPHWKRRLAEPRFGSRRRFPARSKNRNHALGDSDQRSTTRGQDRSDAKPFSDADQRASSAVQDRSDAKPFSDAVRLASSAVEDRSDAKPLGDSSQHPATSGKIRSYQSKLRR